MHVYIASLGNACSGQRAWPELALPASTSLAISASNPVLCYYNGAPDQADCPQTLPGSGYHPGAYAIPSPDAAHAHTWPMPQGATLEIRVPVVSSVTLTNSTLVGYVLSLDGESSPWLTPTEGVYVFSSTPTILYPTPSTVNLNPGYKSSAYVYSHLISGNAYFDLGQTAAYGEFTDGPAPISSSFPAYLVWSDWTPHTLLPNTLYHWRVRFVTATNTYFGADQTFTTLPNGQVKLGSGAAADCSQAAFDAALGAAGLQEITFNCGLLPVTINLSGAKVVTSNLTIDGGSKVTLQGNSTFRLFDVQSGTLTLNNITLSGGSVTGCGGAVHVASSASLVATAASLNNNHAAGNGGALCVDAGGSTVLTNVQINTNSATGSGGGLYNAGSSDIMWAGLSGNTSGAQGGGAYNSGSLAFSVSSIESNGAPEGVARANVAASGAGGGIYNSGTLDLFNSTVAANTGSFGGGIFNSGGTITLTGATIAANSAISSGKSLITSAQAGGLESIVSGSATLRNTLIAGNWVPGMLGGIVEGDCSTSPQKTIVSQGNNLDGDNQCGFTQPSDITNVDPKLGPLANNGGKTRTIALYKGSPAIDAGSNFYCGMYDQRGFSGPTPPGSAVQRQVDGNGDGVATCDIGAFEYHPQLFLPILKH